MISKFFSLTSINNSKRLIWQSVRNSSDESKRLDPPTHKVDNLEKRFLVWTGKYKSIEEVPAYVYQAVVERARNRMRIRIANYMMLATAIGCIAMVYSGKRAAKRGESVTKDNIEWHRQLREDAQAASNVKSN